MLPLKHHFAKNLFLPGIVPHFLLRLVGRRILISFIFFYFFSASRKGSAEKVPKLGDVFLCTCSLNMRSVSPDLASVFSHRVEEAKGNKVTSCLFL